MTDMTDMTQPESSGVGGEEAVHAGAAGGAAPADSADSADGAGGAVDTQGTDGTHGTVDTVRTVDTAGIDDDIIDAEIVETPEPSACGPGAVGGARTTTAATGVPTVTGSARPPEAVTTGSSAAPAWGSPPVPAVPVDPITDYTDAGVPTLAYLQDKVDRRYATALGAHELAEATIPQAAEAAKRREDLAKSARERLEEIRRSLHPDTPEGPGSSTD